MSILIVKQGIADSIQDTGRFGYQHTGINPTGAMDTIAIQLANILVGNDPTAAVIELHFPASVFLFKQQACLAIAGADFGAMINDIPIATHTPVIIQKNCVLQFTKPIKGARAYLAVKGGFTLEHWLNSYSTHLKAGAGGYKGRYLQKNDELSLQEHHCFSSVLKDTDAEQANWKIETRDFYTNDKVIKVIQGKELSLLTEEAIQLFTASSFQITSKSDRMGYRMKGPAIAVPAQPMLSTGITKGTIQILADGQLIILMADHQTTGGYPRIAHVISADIPTLAQLTANDSITFKWVTQQEAEDAYVEQEQHLQQLQNACILRLQEYFTTYGIH
ncbi:MAG: biotin-dependent carboxyltransferase family protein [Bacteroidota bacterium]|nr:biotin-dependent carboxyltransferase family protein [Bacteroidota bacterium]